MNLEQLFSLRSALLVSGLILLVTFLYPLSGDNALYMYMADLLLKGHLPYLGSWDVNYPGIVFLHVPHVLLFGSSTLGFHAYDILLQLVGCMFLYRLTLRLTGKNIAAFSATLASALYYAGGGLSLGGERDIYVALLLMGAVFYLVSGNAKQLPLSGLLLGFALLMRPTVLAYVAVITAWLLMSRSDDRWSKGLRFLVTSLLPLGLFITWYAAIGQAYSFFEATFFYNTAVYARIGMGLQDLQYLQPYWLILIALPLGIWFIWKRTSKDGLLLIAIIVAGVVSLIPVYRFPYHFHPLMLFLFIGSAAGWTVALEYVYLRRSRLAAHAAVVLLICIGSYLIVRTSQLRTAVREFLIKGSLEATHDSFYSSPRWGANVQDSIAIYVLERSGPEDKAQFLTSPMHVPLKARVEPASRFTSVYNLIWRSSRTNDLVPMQHKWRNEFIQDVRNASFIISSRELPDHVFNNGYLPDDVLGTFPEMESVMHTLYDSVRQFGGYTIYRRKAEREP